MDLDGNGGGGGGGRKRKKCNMVEEDDDEESKMEKFLDLIQNLRESLVRNHGGTGWVAIAENNRKKRIHDKGVWEPRFELQDFAHDKDAVAALVAFNNITASKPTPPPTGLDLTLSL